MPRPNPPRKRPRRPAGQKAVRAGAALTKQTAQSAQPKAPSTQRPAGGGSGGTAVAPPPDEMWSRRSYAILVAIMAVVTVPINAIQWALAPASSGGVSKGPISGALLVFSSISGLISLVIASLFAAQIARIVTGERRALRFMESIIVGLVTVFIAQLLYTAVVFIIGAAGTGTATGTPSSCGTATPIAATATAAGATPCPSPSPSAGATASPSTSTSASPSASATANTTLTSITPDVYAAFSIADILALGLTVYIYPALYKRLRIRPRPRPPAAGRKDSRK